MVFDPTILAPLGFGATFVLAIVASLFVSGIIAPGSALSRSEKRADDAMKLLGEANKDIDRLSTVVREQGNQQHNDLTALTTELRESRLRGSR